MPSRPKKVQMDAVASATAMIDALKERGWRLTPQRSAVCQALAGNKTHPSAQVIFEYLRPQFHSLSRATVYNTLEVLVEAGLIQELGHAGDNNIHYDADVAPHINLVCTRCHKIEDYTEAPLKDISDDVSQKTGYELQGSRVVYYGLCPKCRKGK